MMSAYSASLLTALLALPGCIAPDYQSPEPTTDPPAVAPRADTWPALEAAAIRPGARIFVRPPIPFPMDGECTTGFLFRDPNATLYLSVAAHCFPAVSEAQDHCEAGSMPLGTEAHVPGALAPVKLAYSSRLTMETVGETDPETCGQNDFALVRISDQDRGRAHPAILGFAGPTGNATIPPRGATLFAYGNATEWEVSGLQKKTGRANMVYQGTNWTSYAYFSPPGVPGDSGGPVVTDDGKAVGILTEFGASGQNAILHLEPALRYAREHGNMTVELVTWPEFSP